MLNKLLQQIRHLRWQHTAYFALISMLLALMVLYSISRVAFYLYNNSFFPDMSAERLMKILGGGLRFDLTAILYSNLPVILLLILPLQARFRAGYLRVVKGIFLTVNGAMLAFNTADFIYYRFTLRRTTLSVVEQFENERNLVVLFFRFLIDYWYAFLFWLLLVVALRWVVRRIKIEGPQVTDNRIFYLGGIALMAASIHLFIGGVRGGFAHSTRPITISNAAAYATQPQDVHLVLNTPFALLRTARANVIRKVSYFSSEDELR